MLIHGELKQNAAMFDYFTSGEQQDNYKKRFDSLIWWKRWPIKIACKFGRRQHMGAEDSQHTFPVKVWGLTLLILGFVFQTLGVIFPSY